MSEELKNCGTCFFGAPRIYGSWYKNDLICLRHAVSTSSDQGYIAACGYGIGGPRGWRPKEGGFWKNSGKVAPVGTASRFDQHTWESDELPCCSLCGSCAIVNFCANCGVKIDYGEEARDDAVS